MFTEMMAGKGPATPKLAKGKPIRTMPELVGILLEAIGTEVERTTLSGHRNSLRCVDEMNSP